jgi:prolipoprotein diacylglyceryltransferase
MKPILMIFPQATWQYAAFYTAAFLASFIILIAEGRRRKIPQFQWLIVIATGFVSFVVGCRLLTYSQEDWNVVLSNQPLDHSTGLVMLGGLLFCVPCILIVKRLVRLNESVLDAYAFVLPAGMCLQRLGCFLNGCCFGTHTSSWGIHYGPGTSAFYDHYSEGLIPGESLSSLAVHPVQLYESLACLIAIFFLLRVRNRFISPGSLFYLSGLTYYIVRFFTEFFRDSDAYAIEVPVWVGFNAIQWLMLVLIIGSLLIIISKTRSSCPDVRPGGPPIRLSYLFYFFALSMIFFFASKWLRPAEIFVVYLVLFTTAVYLLTELFKTITVPGFRIASLSLILLSLVMMSQTYPEQAASDSTRISYNSISTGGLMGWQTFSAVTEDCDGANLSSTEYNHKYQLMALGFSRTVQTGKARSYTLGLSAYTGKHDEEITGTYSSDRPELTTYGINPFFQADFPKLAIGVGMHFGDMSFISIEPAISSVRRFSVYPQAYMRFGRLERFFAELSFARNFPGSFPANVFQANLGFPFKPKTFNSGVIRIGTSTATGIFVSPSIPIGKHLIMEPYVGFLGSGYMLLEEFEDNMGFVGALNLQYKFAKRPIPQR